MRKRLNITMTVEDNPNFMNRHQRVLARATVGIQTLEGGKAQGVGGHITVDLVAGSERAALTRLGQEIARRVALKLSETSTA